MKGNQPNGTMQSVVTSLNLAGYIWHSCIETTYYFRDGKQGLFLLTVFIEYFKTVFEKY